MTPFFFYLSILIYRFQFISNTYYLSDVPIVYQFNLSYQSNNL